MPQMMPLSWLTLFILFSTALMLFAATNYYSYIPKTKITQKNEIKQKNMAWKW
uniref:ATP synthase complex subunit 8 n=1 Tax=Glyptotermes sp. 15 AB-2022a TaxID=2942721 RepID=A0A8X8M3H2_9NEOP|nr:ATP synthase F0 subunit 8 [Glyptotermes sp. 15 AB-2022a]URX54152.1 ATP synthase F0 subunit 8 [Glyptotermes sp. 15 AB-2022a]URX54191.1 ATP synthase F0 subunit 8 [Glyptotermes sp. 15 AB-2022a]